jgi:hypothetical protein
MAKHPPKSYSKFTYEDLKVLGLEVNIRNLFANETITPIQPSAILSEILEGAKEVSLDTEKARSEFLITPILRELQKNNKTIFAVYSGFSFEVDKEIGLQGFCDYLLVRLPLKVVPDAPIIAVVEAKLSGSLSAAVPQCAAEMYAAQIWNKRYNRPEQAIYGIITNGENWLLLRYKNEMTIEVDSNTYSLTKLEDVLGVLQHVVNQYK